MLNKRCSIALLCITLLLIFITPALASSSQETYNLFNESTGTSTVFDPNNNEEIIKFDPKPDKKTIVDEKNAIDVTPLSITYKVLDHYDQNSAVVDYKKKYVGTSRLDNTANPYTSATLTFQASSSGSWAASATVTGETSAELNLIVTKVDATISVGGTNTRTWTSGYTYGSSLTVPPGRIGEIAAYIPGTSSNGYAVYKVYDLDSGNYVGTQSYPRGAIVPAENFWNMVTKVI